MLCILSIGHFNKPHALVHFLMISLEIRLSMVWDYNFTIRKTIFLKKHTIFMYVYVMIILNILAKLIHVIRHCLNACIRKAVLECHESHEEREKENVSVVRFALAQPCLWPCYL